MTGIGMGRMCPMRPIYPIPLATSPKMPQDIITSLVGSGRYHSFAKPGGEFVFGQAAFGKGEEGQVFFLLRSGQ